MDGLLVFFENGQEIISSYDSDNNCDGPGLMAHIERCRESDTGTRKAERSATKAAQRRIEAADKAALGETFGALATLIRKNMAAAKQPATKPVALKRHRRRRRIKGD
jgi:hypothetical protein